MSITNLDMDLLRTFVTGIRLGNFSQAASKIGRSQSAVSLQLRRLDAQIGTPLFRREGRGLQLTEAGEVFHTYAVRLLELNDEALEAVQRKRVEGEIRLGIPPDLAETWLPRMLARFGRSHPGVFIEARVDRTVTLLDNIATGSLDLALVWEREAPPDTTSVSTVAAMPIVWIATENYALPSAEALPLIMMGEPCLFRAHGLAALGSVGIANRVAFTSSSLAGLWAAVAAGLGVAIRTPAVMPPGLIAFSHPSLPDLGDVALRLHTAESPSGSVQHFSRILVETIEELF